ncbi:hypothetical protein J1N35_015623 [Gossypium stocksii]|uniref:Uncharacterized protein n=1 Tax=Gossypium stocksii TaxID=47602 RepID=A0A9D3VWR4_9ROSI|nr:hypothetical protein J1N35_015623 [Gossypium stocksii]
MSKHISCVEQIASLLHVCGQVNCSLFLPPLFSVLFSSFAAVKNPTNPNMIRPYLSCLSVFCSASDLNVSTISSTCPCLNLSILMICLSFSFISGVQLGDYEERDYDGLEPALGTGWWRHPDYLEPIATRIEKARGEATADIQKVSLLLVSAAVKEMEELTIENSKWDMLKKWAATLNAAKKSGFIVEFADNLLQTKLFAYFAYFSNVG